MHRTALKGKKTHELLCIRCQLYISSYPGLRLQDLLQNLLKCYKDGVSRIVCSCLIYFHFKNQFGGLISHHLHRNPWRLAGCHLQAFISAIVLPWLIKMSLALSDTIDSNDTLPRASHGTCTRCETSCFFLRPFLYFQVPYLCIWSCLLCAQVPWPLIFSRNTLMPITLAEPSHTLKLSLTREGETKRPGRRCCPFKTGSTPCWGCFCSDPSILHSGLFHHLLQSSGQQYRGSWWDLPTLSVSLVVAWFQNIYNSSLSGDLQ